MTFRLWEPIPDPPPKPKERGWMKEDWLESVKDGLDDLRRVIAKTEEEYNKAAEDGCEAARRAVQAKEKVKTLREQEKALVAVVQFLEGGKVG